MSIIKDLQDQIEVLQNRIKKIQDECNHPHACVDKKYDGSSGNYDPTADCYWINHHCQLCDKRWTTDQ